MCNCVCNCSTDCKHEEERGTCVGGGWEMVGVGGGGWEEGGREGRVVGLQGKRG